MEQRSGVDPEVEAVARALCKGPQEELVPHSGKPSWTLWIEDAATAIEAIDKIRSQPKHRDR